MRLSVATILTLGIIYCGGVEGASADSISFDSTSSGSRVDVPNQNDDFDLASSDSGGSVDTSQTKGGSSASNDVDTATSSLAELSGSWTIGSIDVTTYSFGSVTFTVDGDFTYGIDGGFEFDSGTDDGSFRVYLVDLSASAYVFHQSDSLSGSGAQDIDLSGSGLTGSLVDGHEYIFYMHGEGTSNTSSTIDGSAWANLTLTSAASPVPEPGTVALLSVGLAGLALARRRRKTA